MEEKKYKGMTHYEVGATQGHSKKKVDSMIKRAKREGSAHEKALGNVLKGQNIEGKKK